MAAMAAPLTRQRLRPLALASGPEAPFAWRLRSPGRIGFLQRRKDWQFVSIQKVNLPQMGVAADQFVCLARRA